MIKFAHVRPNLNPRSGGYTIAFVQTGPRKVEVALARCNPKDNFNKALGRKIAVGRLSAGESFTINTRAQKYGNIVKAAIDAADEYIAWERVANSYTY